MTTEKLSNSKNDCEGEPVLHPILQNNFESSVEFQNSDETIVISDDEEELEERRPILIKLDIEC